MLGLGPDGHTASLFPGHELLSYKGDRIVVPITDSPKPPSSRITLTLDSINTSAEVVFIATGEAKASKLLEILAPEESRSKLDTCSVLPPMLIRPRQLLWIIDEPAAALIRDHPNIEFVV